MVAPVKFSHIGQIDQLDIPIRYDRVLKWTSEEPTAYKMLIWTYYERDSLSTRHKITLGWLENLIFFLNFIIINIDRLIGQEEWVFANDPGDLGWIRGRVIPKT